MNEIDTTNKFMVAARAGGGIVIINPPGAPFSSNDALLLAAYLVSLAEPFASHGVAAVLAAVHDA